MLHSKQKLALYLRIDKDIKVLISNTYIYINIETTYHTTQAYLDILGQLYLLVQVPHRHNYSTLDLRFCQSLHNPGSSRSHCTDYLCCTIHTKNLSSSESVKSHFDQIVNVYVFS